MNKYFNEVVSHIEIKSDTKENNTKFSVNDFDYILFIISKINQFYANLDIGEEIVEEIKKFRNIDIK